MFGVAFIMFLKYYLLDSDNKTKMYLDKKIIMIKI